MARRDFDTEFWEIICFNDEDERDPIELAAADFRLMRAARYIVVGEIDGEFAGELDYMELLAMIRYEYMLSPEEVDTAMSISEDRLV
jgi:hypothetical protein